MKKINVQKFGLNRETIRVLTGHQLHAAVGGEVPSNPGCPTSEIPGACKSEYASDCECWLTGVKQ